MKEKLTQNLPHLLLSLLETAGLLLPLLGILKLSDQIIPAILTAATLLILLEACRLNSKLAVIAPVVCLSGFAAWLFVGNGMAVIKDVLLGATLQFNGIPVSLALVGRETAILTAAILSFIVFWLSVPNFGGILLFLLSLFVFVLIWYFDRFDLLWSFAPAAIASIVYVIRFSDPEVSVLRLLPWITLLMVLALVITPKDGFTIPEMKEAADELRQTVTDTFFFTDPRNVFSLADEGYYPQGRSQLGGKAEVSDIPIMEVSTSDKLWLRGVTMDEYDGRCWRNTAGGRRYLWSARAWQKHRSSVFNMDLPASGSFVSAFVPIDFSVRVLSESASTLFLPQRIRELRPGGSLVPYYNASSEVFITRNLQPGDTYSGTAYNFISGTPGLSNLIDVCSLSDDPAMLEITNTFTALPDHLESRLWDLALTASGNAVTPYEKAFTIQNWLSRNYRYTLDVSDQPQDLDFVTNFLFNTKEGYCTYFASAMTVLCRMVGLPARYVEGFLIEPDENGKALITGKDAHAWTEIYFSGFGWVTFDATPNSGNKSNQNSGDQDPISTPTPEPSMEPTPEAQVTPEPEDTTDPDHEPTPTPTATPVPSPEDPTPLPTVPPVAPESGSSDQSPDTTEKVRGSLWILVLLVLIGTVVFRIFLTDPERLSRKAKHSAGEYSAWRIWTQDLFDVLHAAGADIRPGETPMSFTRRCEEDGLCNGSLKTAGECISLICYGHVAPNETDTALIREAALSCRNGLEKPVLIRYFVRRSFISLSKRSFNRISV